LKAHTYFQESWSLWSCLSGRPTTGCRHDSGFLLLRLLNANAERVCGVVFDSAPERQKWSWCTVATGHLCPSTPHTSLVTTTSSIHRPYSYLGQGFAPTYKSASKIHFGMDVDQGAQIPDQLILYRLAPKCVISGFRREVEENGAGLLYYAACSRPTWRWDDRLSRNVGKKLPLHVA